MDVWRLAPSLASLRLRWLIDEHKDACNAVPGFLPNMTGGDGDGTQFCEHRFDLTGPASTWF
jgi:hypothetical protein